MVINNLHLTSEGSTYYENDDFYLISPSRAILIAINVNL